MSARIARLRAMPDRSPLELLPTGLPPGRLVLPDPEFAENTRTADRPVLWVSDGVLPSAELIRLWSRFHAIRDETGLCPLLLQGLADEPERPWHVGELSPLPVGAIDALTPGGVLRRFWSEVELLEEDQDDLDEMPGLDEISETAGSNEVNETDEVDEVDAMDTIEGLRESEDPRDGDEFPRPEPRPGGPSLAGGVRAVRDDRIAAGTVEHDEVVRARTPYDAWPGLAPVARADDPQAADAAALACVAHHVELAAYYFGLVPATRGADALSASGWDGPCNHAHTHEISAVIRSWEDRFGARVVVVGFDTLILSVATPPATVEQARHIAAEHHAFCPDNILRGGQDFEEYARSLVGEPRWYFWWD